MAFYCLIRNNQLRIHTKTQQSNIHVNRLNFEFVAQYECGNRSLLCFDSNKYIQES